LDAVGLAGRANDIQGEGLISMAWTSCGKPHQRAEWSEHDSEAGILELLYDVATWNAARPWEHVCTMQSERNNVFFRQFDFGRAAVNAAIDGRMTDGGLAGILHREGS
jgi:hypothetical protein